MRPLLSLLVGRRRRACRRPVLLALEMLEDRALPTGIVWVNRDTVTDTFTQPEHAVIDRAIQLWNQRLQLNAPLLVTFLGGSSSGLNLGPNVLGDTLDVAVNANGTGSATVEIAGNGGGWGWFIDPTPQDNQGFPQAAPNGTSFLGGPNQPDLLTTVTHELGHALGLVYSSAPLQARLTAVQNNTALFHGTGNYLAHVSIDGDGIHLPAAYYPDDLMNPVQHLGERALPSAADLRILVDTYGYRLNTPAPVTLPLASAPAFTAGTFDPSTATWYLRDSNTAGAPAAPFSYGPPGSIPVSGDWFGNGTSSVGVFDPATATWYLGAGDSPGAPALPPFPYGAPGWVPVVGDWNGDGVATIGVVDPSTMTWYLRNSNSPGAPDYAPFQYGAPGWVPVAGDWDGNGTATVGVVDPATATWYLRNSNTPGAPDAAPFQYGGAGWKPVVGRWVSNGPTTIGTVDPGTGTWYLRNSNTPGAPTVAPFVYGLGSWTPVAGSWDLSSLAAAASQAGGANPGPPRLIDITANRALDQLLPQAPGGNAVGENTSGPTYSLADEVFRVGAPGSPLATRLFVDGG